MLLIDFFLGAVAMQVVYLFYHFILSRRFEFLYYLLFVCSISIFIAVIKWDEISDRSLGVFDDNRNAFGFSILFFAIMLYFRFVRYISGIHQKNGRVNFILRIFETSFIIMALAIILEILLFGKPYFTPLPGRVLYIISFAAQVYLLVELVRSTIILNYFIVAGSLGMSILIKQVIIPVVFHQQVEQSRLLSYILMGVILDFLFLNFALVYRSRQLEKEKFKMKLARQAELYNQRLEISNDLHDDVGATLGSLQVYSTIARQSLSNPEVAAGYMDKIGAGIRKVMENMNDVIWAVKNDSGNEKLFSSKIKDYYVDILDACNIEGEYRMEEGLEQQLTRMLVRKNLLLITKEAVNNIIRHSYATRVVITMERKDSMVILSIEDNGKGIDIKKNRGNGLSSMEIRSKQMGGEFRAFAAKEGKGTRIECKVPIANISD